MADLDLDALETVCDSAAHWWDKCQDYPEVDEHIATFTPWTVKALIARVRRAESSRTEDQIREAVNECCTCGGSGPSSDGCPACEVWHELEIKWP